jgi:serine/threonine protein kinase
MQCPSETIIVLFTAGHLAPAERQDVATHVGQCDSCRRAVAAVAADPTDTPPIPAIRNPSTLTAGTVIDGRYRIAHQIGRGGMGVVYRAVHLRLLQDVAIKFVATNDVSGGVRARFLREAQLGARICGHFAPRVIDVGMSPEFGDYLVMEYLTGQDLAVLLVGELLPVTKAVDVIVQVCIAIDAVHRAGVVHRDLKPSNLFLQTNESEPGAGSVKVLDFGLSKSNRSAPNDELQLTHSHTMLGTPLYLAPEQAANASRVDHRADIWSVGAIAYQMLTGSPPFPGTSLVEVIAKISNAVPVMPLTSSTGTIPSGLNLAVCRSLAKSPSDRRQTMMAFAQAIAPFGTEKSALAMRHPTYATQDPGEAALPNTQRSNKYAKKYAMRSTLLATTAAAVAVAVGSGQLSTMHHQTNVVPMPYEQQKVFRVDGGVAHLLPVNDDGIFVPSVVVGASSDDSEVQQPFLIPMQGSLRRSNAQAVKLETDRFTMNATMANEMANMSSTERIAALQARGFPLSEQSQVDSDNPNILVLVTPPSASANSGRHR